MSSFWNHNLTVSIFGESHGPAIGVVLDKLPSGEFIDPEEIRNFMARRAPKKDATSTPRRENDMPNILSGIHNNYTTGTPLSAFINNTDTHSQDYSNLSKLARPGHADYTGALRYKGFNDVRGGGHFSGRLTAPLCFAGSICGQILEQSSEGTESESSFLAESSRPCALSAILPQWCSQHLYFRGEGWSRSSLEVHRFARNLLASGQCSRCEESGHSSVYHHSLPAFAGGTGSPAHHTFHHSFVNRYRAYCRLVRGYQSSIG